MRTPQVSVVMPVHDGERYVRAAIDSVLTQTLRDLELIVVDDASSDATPEILRAIDDPRLRVHRNERNLGVAATLNEGLRLAHAPLIARLDADDVASPERLARQVAFLAANPEVMAVGSNITVVDENDRVLRRSSFPTRPALVRWRMLFENCLAHPTVIVRRELFDAVGDYDPSFVAAEDYELWLRAIASDLPLANLDEHLVRYRAHATSTTITLAPQSSTHALRARREVLSRATDLVIDADALEVLRDPERLRGSSDPDLPFAAVELLHALHAFVTRVDTPTADERAITRHLTRKLAWIATVLARQRPTAVPKLLRRSPMLSWHQLLAHWLRPR